MKRKVCKKCKLFVDENICPRCKGDQFSTNWQGRIAIIDVAKSKIAAKLGITERGEYAIKVK